MLLRMNEKLTREALPSLREAAKMPGNGEPSLPGTALKLSLPSPTTNGILIFEIRAYSRLGAAAHPPALM
jgi:hypothetical protein